MPPFNNPTDIAREALKRLATHRIPPTPENFERVYRDVAGTPALASDLEIALQKALGEMARLSAPLDRSSKQAQKALTQHNWPALQASLVALAARCVEDQLEWAELIRNLIRQWDLKQTRVPPAAKREGLERVLVNFGDDPKALYEKLGSLVAVWAESKTPVQPAAPEEGGAARSQPPATVAEGLRRLLAQTLELGVAERLADKPALSSAARELAQRALQAEDAPAVEDLTLRLKRFWFDLELKGQPEAQVADGLLKMLRLLVDNISELLLDDQWLKGQITVLQGLMSGPLDPVTITGAELALREVIVKQGSLKHSLNEAKATLKEMVATFIDRLGELSESTGVYHDRIGQYAEELGRTDDIIQINHVLQRLLGDTKGMQLDMLRSRDELKLAQRQVEQAERRIRELESELQSISGLVEQDYLTGTLNRRGLTEAFGREVARTERSLVPLCVSLLDIDHFKRLNDTYGHDAGDAALVYLVGVVKRILRPTDVIARYGGEEFVILLPDSDLKGAAHVMTRVQRELTKHFFLQENQRILITFSAGVTQWREGDTQDSALTRADKALYQAKAAGRNRVVVTAD